MRKLLIAGLAVASITGIAYAQTADQDAENYTNWWREHLRLRSNRNPPTCVDVAGATRQINETTSIGTLLFRCAEAFGGARLQLNGANWVLVAPCLEFPQTETVPRAGTPGWQRPETLIETAVSTGS